MKTTSTVVPLNENQLIQNFLRLLEAQLKEGTSIAKSLAFAAIWSFGGSITPESRIPFNDLIQGLPIA